MAPSWRARAVAPFAALAGVAAVAWIGLFGYGWSDYEIEALRSVEALVHGHLATFASLAPAYGGSLLLRAPFALLPSLWGGGNLAVYRALALPCLLAAAALGLWVHRRMRRAGASAVARAVALALFVCSPVMLPILELGHPEEILCACLCVAAVLLAAGGRPLAAGLLLGLAIGCKYWPVIAIGPVLLVLPQRRPRCLLACAFGAAALLAPIALLGSHFVAASSSAASTSSTIFQPWQAFWFVGVHGPVVHGLFGEVKPGYRTAPSWVGPISHPLVVLIGLALPAALWWQRGRRRLTGAGASGSGTGASTGVGTESRTEPLRARIESLRLSIPLADALLLMALTMLARCLFDTFDNVCYTLPFLFALLTWESSAGGSFAARRPALLALSAAALAWISFEVMPSIASADAQSAFFLAWTVPLAAQLAIRLYSPRLRTRLPAVLRPRSAPSATS
jgi:Glycosyltransferase family 87